MSGIVAYLNIEYNNTRHIIMACNPDYGCNSPGCIVMLRKEKQHVYEDNILLKANVPVRRSCSSIATTGQINAISNFVHKSYNDTISDEKHKLIQENNQLKENLQYYCAKVFEVCDINDKLTTENIDLITKNNNLQSINSILYSVNNKDEDIIDVVN